MAATMDPRSPLPNNVKTLQRTPIAKHSSLCTELRQDGRIDSVSAARITDYGSQTEKSTPVIVNQRKKKLPAARKETNDIGKRKSKKLPENKDLPKRPATAFIHFLTSFKEDFKKENPNVKSVVTVSKSAGAKWKSMSDEEKQPFFKLAAEGKPAYLDESESFRKRQFSQLGYKDQQDGCAEAANSSIALCESTDKTEMVGDNLNV